MRRSTRQLCLTALAFLAGVGREETALAFTYANKCNGEASHFEGSLDLTRNACSIPSSGNVHKSYEHAATLWDRSVNKNVFTDDFTTGCSTTLGNWLNEVALVNPSEIDGNTGLTDYAHANFCFFSGWGDWGEADAWVSNEVSFANPPQEQVAHLTTGQVGLGRITMQHELGHVLGLGDPGGPGYNLMGYFDWPTRGGTGSTEHASPFPDDVEGMRSLYGAKAITNLFATSQFWHFGQNLTFAHETTSVQVCKSQAGSMMVSWTAINLGNQPVTFDQEIIVTSAFEPDESSVVRQLIRWNGGTINPRKWLTWNAQLVSLPRDIPVGAYHIWHRIFPVAGDVALGDNAAHRAGKFHLVDC